MNKIFAEYIAKNKELMYQTLKELSLIPAPSNFEHDRAQYCKAWLEKYGAENVYIDEVQNVIFPINCDDSKRLTVFAAHTDTVFPDREPMPYFDDGKKIFCPGVADDTASVVVILLCAKFFIENNIRPKNGVLFVLNSCEEGLGNLKGTRQLFVDFCGRIETYVTLDSNLGVLVNSCVGSHRYEVTVATPGGHSFHAFGNANAIVEMSKIIANIYKIKVPQKEGTKTTYNVGIVEGGTSVNSIAQSAKMLCEYRSNDGECLAFMRQEFEKIFAEAAESAEVKVTLVGDRPCGNIAPEKIVTLEEKIVPIVEEAIGKEAKLISGSTDSNIPLSMGVAAICIGANTHGNIHTREEWVDKDSIQTGLYITLRASIKLTQ